MKDNKKTPYTKEPAKRGHANDWVPAEKGTNAPDMSGQNVAGNRADQPGTLTGGPDGKSQTPQPNTKEAESKNRERSNKQ